MTDRLVTPLSTLLATAFVGGLVSGSTLLPLLVLPPSFALLVYVAVRRRRPPLADPTWAPTSYEPPVLAAPGNPRKVAAALGRVEAHELGRSPWFGVGLGFLLAILVTFGIAYAGDNGAVWLEIVGMAPWYAHPLAGMTIIAVHRAATRPARDGTEELFESCPTEPVVRAGALLRTAIVPLAVFAGFLVAYGATLTFTSPAIHGPVSVDAVPVVLAGFILVVGAVFLGVALGSWVRFGLAPVVAVIAIGFLALRLATAGGSGWNRSSALSTFGPTSDSTLLRPLLPVWWHLLWLASLTVLVAMVAVARFRRDRRVLITGMVAVGAAVVAALFATAGPGAGDARHVADLIARPADHQRCERRPGTRLDVCTYRGYGEMRARLTDALDPVGRALPAAATPVTIRHGYTGTEEELPAEVRRLLPSGVPQPGDDEVVIEFAADDSALLEYRLLVAFTALGLSLPSDAPEDGPLAIDGEARGVVALWLAAQELDLEDALHLATVDDPGDSDENLIRDVEHDPFERGLAWPTMCGPVVWAPQDLEAARALIRAPQGEVSAVVGEGFERWSDPKTTTEELLAAFGLPDTSPHETVESRRESYC